MRACGTGRQEDESGGQQEGEGRTEWAKDSLRHGVIFSRDRRGRLDPGKPRTHRARGFSGGGISPALRGGGA
ncbi:hypothetical protein GCM10009758_22950 [Microbacterium hatanonis]